MPFIEMRLPEVEKSITRPAVFAIVRQVMEITNIPSDIHIAFKDDAAGIAQNGSTQLSSSDRTQLAGESLLSIEVNEKYDQDYMSSTPVSRRENRPVVMDDALGLMVRPIYSHNQFEVNFTYNSKSRNEALAWRDAVRIKVSQMRDVNLHEVSYHYSIPAEFMFLLREIHKLRENVAGYGQDFDQWFQDIASTKMTEIANQDGSSVRWAVAEKQVRIQGWFAFGSNPDQVEKGPDGGKWSVSFTYNFSFDKPLQVQMLYPVMVHNQLLNPKYIPTDPVNLEEMQKDGAVATRALGKFEVHERRKMFTQDFQVLKSPRYDEWVPTSMPPNLMPVFTVLCEVDPAQPKYLLDLHELGDFELDPEILEYLRKVEWRYLNQPTKSMFHINVFRNAFLTHYENSHVTQDLKVMTREPLDLRRNNRVLLSFANSILTVDKLALRRMAEYPNVLRKVLMSINVNKHQLELVRPRVDLMHFFEDLPDMGTDRATINKNHVGFNTVNTSFVTARKLRDYPGPL